MQLLEFSLYTTHVNMPKQLTTLNIHRLKNPLGNWQFGSLQLRRTLRIPGLSQHLHDFLGSVACCGTRLCASMCFLAGWQGAMRFAHYVQFGCDAHAWIAASAQLRRSMKLLWFPTHIIPSKYTVKTVNHRIISQPRIQKLPESKNRFKTILENWLLNQNKLDTLSCFYFAQGFYFIFILFLFLPFYLKILWLLINLFLTT